MSDKGDKAYRAYRVAAAINNSVHGSGSLAAEIANNNALGDVALKDDLGTYGGIADLNFADDLDQRTRDRLISHTRQDVASTFGHAVSAFKAAHEAKEIARGTRRLARWALLLMIVLTLQGCLILAAVS